MSFKYLEDIVDSSSGPDNEELVAVRPGFAKLSFGLLEDHRWHLEPGYRLQAHSGTVLWMKPFTFSDSWIW